MVSRPRTTSTTLASADMYRSFIYLALPDGRSASLDRCRVLSRGAAPRLPASLLPCRRKASGALQDCHVSVPTSRQVARAASCGAVMGASWCSMSAHIPTAPPARIGTAADVERARAFAFSSLAAGDPLPALDWLDQVDAARTCSAPASSWRARSGSAPASRSMTSTSCRRAWRRPIACSRTRSRPTTPSRGRCWRAPSAPSGCSRRSSVRAASMRASRTADRAWRSPAGAWHARWRCPSWTPTSAPRARRH